MLDFLLFYYNLSVTGGEQKNHFLCLDSIGQAFTFLNVAPFQALGAVLCCCAAQKRALEVGTQRPGVFDNKQ